MNPASTWITLTHACMSVRAGYSSDTWSASVVTCYTTKNIFTTSDTREMGYYPFVICFLNCPPQKSLDDRIDRRITTAREEFKG